MADYEESDSRDRVDEYREERSISPERSYDRRSNSPRRESPRRDSPRRGSPRREEDKPMTDVRDRDDVEHRGEDEDAKNEGTNLFVTGLSKSVTEPELEELFTQYGAVDKCQIMTDPHTQESRGFGFVNMLDVAGADNAISSLNGTSFVGRTLSIEKAKRKRPRTPTPGKYFGPPKARRGGRPRYDDRYRDGGRDYGRRYDDRPRYDDPYRRPRYDDRGDYRDRYYRGRDRGDRDRGDRYGPRYDERDRYPPRDYRDRYERRYSREDRPPVSEPRDDRYRDDRDRYPAPLPPTDGYRDREDYRP